MRNPKILVASVLVTAALVTVATDIATATTTATSRKRLHSLNSVVSTSGYRVMRTESPSDSIYDYGARYTQ